MSYLSGVKRDNRGCPWKWGGGHGDGPIRWCCEKGEGW